MAEDIQSENKWQDLLSEVEEDITKHEKEIQSLKEMGNLLRKKLGMSIEENIATFSTVDNGAAENTQTTFNKGDLYGLSHAEAGHRALERAGRQLTVDDILKMIVDAGFKIGGKDAKRTLYGSLVRSRKLVLVAKNTFDLAERRPQKKRKKRKYEKKFVRKDTSKKETNDTKE